jgi:hypothetical protein
MMERVIAAAALCMASEAALAQYAPQGQTRSQGQARYSARGTSRPSRLVIEQPGNPSPAAGCFAVSPDVTVTIIQSYPKLPGGGAIWQVQLGRTLGFLVFSLAPSIPPAAVVAQPARPSQPAPAAKPSDGTFATASLSPAPAPPDQFKRPTDVSAVAASPEKPEIERAKTAALPTTEIALLIVKESRQRYYASGRPCACPEDVTVRAVVRR